MHKLLTLVAVLTFISGAVSATTYPLTLTDDLGRKVTLKSEPRRIISTLPSTTETVCALGACGLLVGVDDWSDFPERVSKLPRVGGLYTPNIEAVIALKPDLVLVSKYGKLASALDQAGIPNLALNPETYSEVFSKTLVIGHILNREMQAKNLVSNMRRDIAAVEALVKNTIRPTTYYEVDPTPYSVGPNSFIGVLLNKAGAHNIIPASFGDFPRVDPEFIVKANPQLILGLDRQIALGRPGWRSIQALRNGRVHEIPKELSVILGRPGPRLPTALRGLARLVHPQLFPSR